VHSNELSRRKSKSRLHRQGNNCSSGFGFQGKCLTDIKTILKLKTAPKSIENLWNENVIKVFEKWTEGTTACMGDYKVAETSLKEYKCATIPWRGGETMGHFAVNTTKLSCSNGAQVRFCVTFDKCGSFGMAVNSAALKCLAAATGVGVTGMLADGIVNTDHAAFAFSLNKKLEISYDIAVFTDQGFGTKNIKVNGHFYVGLAISVPNSWLEKIKIGEKTGDKFIKLSINVNTLLDLGNVGDMVKNTVSALSKPGSNSKNMIDSILKSNAELSIVANGKLELALSQLTNGFLPDLSYEIKDCKLLLTAGGRTSGVSRGLYVRILLNNMKDFNKEFRGNLDKIFGHYKGILGNFQFPDFNRAANIAISVGIDQTRAGFEFKCDLITITCIFNIKDMKGSCGFGSNFFTGLLQNGEYNIKQAKNFSMTLGKRLAK
jgi:hypothetical protein